MNKEHHHSSTCLVGFQQGDHTGRHLLHQGGTTEVAGEGFCWMTPIPCTCGKGGVRGESVHSRGAAGSPAREPAFVPCPARGHSTGIVPGLPGKMGGVPCEIFPYTKTASELGSKEGTIQTFEKIHIHTPQPNNTHSVLRERETHELGV